MAWYPPWYFGCARTLITHLFYVIIREDNYSVCSLFHFFLFTAHYQPEPSCGWDPPWEIVKPKRERHLIRTWIAQASFSQAGENNLPVLALISIREHTSWWSCPEPPIYKTSKASTTMKWGTDHCGRCQYQQGSMNHAVSRGSKLR